MPFMPLNRDDREFLRKFYNRLNPIEALQPDDQRYVKLDADVPNQAAPRGQQLVPLLRDTIVMSEGVTTQLYSGSPGSGKSTELNRLAAALRKSGYIVLQSDAEDYLSPSDPIAVTDLLIALAGAFGEATAAETGEDPTKEGYWTRFVNFCQTEVIIKDLDLKVVKASLRGDPTFKKRLRDALAGNLMRLTEQVHGYVDECVARLQAHSQGAAGFVFILDSLEHLQGSPPEEVCQSIGTVFSSHADKLRLEHCHVVYSVPQYLGVLNPEVKGLYSGAIRMLPMTKLSQRDNPSVPCRAGVEAFVSVIEKRGDWRRLLGDDRALLERVVLASGGYLRDLLRSVREITLQANQLEQLPVPAPVVEAVLAMLARDYQRLSRADAEWLAKVARTRGSCLPEMKDYSRLATLLRAHMVLYYQNGEEWYDVHPLARDEILRLAGPPPAPEP
ncbi:MAG: hypothetical protein HY906_14265 [Deltaproteobacteria bacterium]|nr:hypothetical protein [Deltaproteobacteria bacterium]